MRKLFIVLAVLVAASFGARAQALEDIIYTVGTTTKDATARDWGYVVWQATDPGLIKGRHFAIYSKPGAANSANPFTRTSIVTAQTDPAVIQVILNRAVNLGESLAELETRINNLFQKIMPPGTATLADKVSIVIRGSLDDPNYFGNLMVLARLHPSISICLGMGHATLLPPGTTTFEVREYDFAKQQDISVVGRVTLQAGVVIELPATGPAVAVPDSSAKADLNVRLRWGTPDDLRRLSLLNYGFNVYRMTKAFAEANNYHTTPPSAAALLSLAGNPNVKKLNNQPILKNREYTVLTAPNFVADPTNAFFADDNRRYEPGGVPLVNGDKFYYYVAPRDVLGRIGKVSVGTLVTICDKLPPNSPTGVKVVNDYHYVGGVSKQTLKVEWKQDNSGTDTIKSYYVYRWQSPDQVQAQAANPALHRIAGPIPHVPGQESASYVDDGAGAPAMPADAGKTFWYTVRSEDTSACGGNLSPNSGPAFGVLRDRVGPEAPGGWVDLLCRRPVVVSDRYKSEPDRDQQNQSLAYYTMVCSRKDTGIAWAEFYVFDLSAPSNYIGRVYFQPKDSEVRLPFSMSRQALDKGANFYCRVGSSNGKVSNFVLNQGVGVPTFGENRNVLFIAETLSQKFRPTPNSTRKGDCWRHDPVPPGNPGEPGTVTPTDVTITLTPGTKEYKLYRRVDFGQLTLIKQGPANFDDVTQITIPDEAMPPNAGSICYYGQLFDEHGNASPMTLLGDDCIVVAGTTPLPTPMLAAPEIDGTEATPKMTVKWFCPPYGVERFQMYVSVDPAFPVQPATISSVLSTNVSPAPTSVIYKIDGETKTNDFWIYRTPRVGPGFGNGASFDVEINVTQGKKYTIFVTAIGKDDNESPRSNVEAAEWSPAVAVGPQVPWPARPLPAVNIFSTNLVATRLPPFVYDGIGVRIGWISERVTPRQDNKLPIFIYSQENPMIYVSTNASGEKLFPVAMYRVQTASAAFPNVSGDVVQVTPLMESIAYSNDIVGGQSGVTIKDPFITVGPATPGTTFQASPMYLLDTSPVIAGARYLYLLVRFDSETREIREIAISSIVEVTP